MKVLNLCKSLIFVIIINSTAFSQIDFTESPQNYQLFPRDTNNAAIVKFKGNITDNVYKKISLYVKKDNVFYAYQVQNFPSNQSQPFDFYLQSQIYANPVEYDFRVYLHNSSGDSTEVLHRERIVCGDIYVLYGQSNIVALAGVEELYNEIDDRLLRNFDFEGGNLQLYSLKWLPSKQPYGRVGGIGMNLQKMILQEYGIPTCVINGGYGGLNIRALNDRLQGSPFALHTVYGQLYTRVKYAEAIGKIKAIVWRQGEAEACSWSGDINNYPSVFADLYNNLKTDLGDFNKFYNIQITIHGCNFLEEAGKLREFMRKTKYLYNNIETSTAIGVRLADDFHHAKQENKQVANEVFQMMKSDIYQATPDIENHPPDIQKIIKSTAGDILTLVFEEGQKMKYPNDTTIHSSVWKMKDYLYINSITNANTNLIEQGWAQGNKIILKLTQAIDSGFLTYLPSYAMTNPPSQEIHLKNSKGLRAMSFYQFPIADFLVTPTIDSIKYISQGQLKLVFNDADTKIIERKATGETDFTRIGKSSGNTFIDNLYLNNEESVYYRIKKETATSESNYSPEKVFTMTTCNDLQLSGDVITEIISKGRKIESTQKIYAKTYYHFQKAVELKAGFETKNNAVFKAISSGCQD